MRNILVLSLGVAVGLAGCKGRKNAGQGDTNRFLGTVEYQIEMTGGEIPSDLRQFADLRFTYIGTKNQMALQLYPRTEEDRIEFFLDPTRSEATAVNYKQEEYIEASFDELPEEMRKTKIQTVKTDASRTVLGHTCSGREVTVPMELPFPLQVVFFIAEDMPTDVYPQVAENSPLGILAAVQDGVPLRIELRIDLIGLELAIVAKKITPNPNAEPVSIPRNFKPVTTEKVFGGLPGMK